MVEETWYWIIENQADFADKDVPIGTSTRARGGFVKIKGLQNADTRERTPKGWSFLSYLYTNQDRVIKCWFLAQGSRLAVSTVMFKLWHWTPLILYYRHELHNDLMTSQLQTRSSPYQFWSSSKYPTWLCNYSEPILENQEHVHIR
jgi:hypothetical protein